MCQALIELGIGKREIGKIGITLYKVRMPWPLEPIGIRKFSEGLEEILIVEERREIIENQIKQQLFNWRPESDLVLLVSSMKTKDLSSHYHPV